MYFFGNRLFLTLMLHKVVWQHTQGVVGFFITTVLQIICEKNFENRLRFDRIVTMSLHITVKNKTDIYQ